MVDSGSPLRWQWWRHYGWRLLLTLWLTGFVSLLCYRRSYFIPSGVLLLFSLALWIRYGHELWRDPAVRLLGVFSLAVVAPLLLVWPAALAPAKTLMSAAMVAAMWLVGCSAIWLLRRFQLTLWVQYAVFAILLFWTLDGLWQAIFGVDWFGVTRSERLGAFFTSPNKFGWYIGMLSGLLLLPTLTWCRLGIWQWLLMMLVLAVVFLGNTRAAWIVCALTLGLRWWYLPGRGGRRYGWLLLPLVLPLVTVGSVYALDNSFSQRLQSTWPDYWSFEALNQALAYRPALWRFAVEQITLHPWFGQGVNAFEHLSLHAYEQGSPRYLYQPHAHQLLLEIWLVTGPLGLLALGWGCSRLWRAWQQAPVTARHQALPLLGTCALFWFPFNTHRDFYASEAMHMTWWLLALGLAALVPHQYSSQYSKG